MNAKSFATDPNIQLHPLIDITVGVIVANFPSTMQQFFALDSKFCPWTIRYQDINWRQVLPSPCSS